MVIEILLLFAERIFISSNISEYKKGSPSTILVADSPIMTSLLWILEALSRRLSSILNFFSIFMSAGLDLCEQKIQSSGHFDVNAKTMLIFYL